NPVYLRPLNQIASIAWQKRAGAGIHLRLERVVVVIVSGDEHRVLRAEGMVDLQAVRVVKLGARLIKRIVVTRNDAQGGGNSRTRIEAEQRDTDRTQPVLRNAVSCEGGVVRGVSDNLLWQQSTEIAALHGIGRDRGQRSNGSGKSEPFIAIEEERTVF